MNSFSFHEAVKVLCLLTLKSFLRNAALRFLINNASMIFLFSVNLGVILSGPLCKHLFPESRYKWGLKLEN